MGITRCWRLASVIALTALPVACSSTRQHLATTTSAVDSTPSSTTIDASTSSVTPLTEPATVPSSATVAPTTTTAGPRPGAVTITNAGSGGGSGELEVNWNAAVGATGYRVYRSNAVAGPFIIMVTVNVVTGDTTVHSGVVNVYGDRQNFWPRPYHGSGTSSTFNYVELDIGGGPHTYYRVVAFNSNGHGPTGATVCARISGQPAC